MTDRPILFSAPMVQALLAGKKTQTRRVLKDQTPWERAGDKLLANFPRQTTGVPYANGDRLWVRERVTLKYMENFLTGKPTENVIAAFAADSENVVEKLGFQVSPWWKNLNGDLSPLFMPRWASRLTLTVTDVRVQRLQDISRDDVIAEGITEREGSPIEDVWAGWHEPYAALWDELNGDGAWALNPWIVALTFSVEHQNIDANAPACEAVG